MADVVVQMEKQTQQNPPNSGKKVPSGLNRAPAEPSTSKADGNVQNKTSKSQQTSKTSTSQSQTRAPASHSQTQIAASLSQATDRVNKEILLILKEMNEKLNSQAEQIKSQDEKIDSLMSGDVDYQNAGYDYDYSEQDYDESAGFEDQSSMADEDPSTSPSNVFKSLAGKYQQAESVDNEVNDCLASFVNVSFRNGITDEKQSELTKSINRPVNCESLTKTRVNQGIWRLLKPNTQADDNKMQQIQNLIVKSACNITKLLDKNKGTLAMEDIGWGSDAIVLLGQANKMINTKRKEQHKWDLDPKYHYLASPSLPYTEFLYGEDVDFNKNVREINDMSRVGRNLSRGGYPQRGGFRGKRFPGTHPYPRRGFRGRGGQQRPAAMPKNLRGAFKK